jgi:CheY-like chemotaxis protein
MIRWLPRMNGLLEQAIVAHPAFATGRAAGPQRRDLRAGRFTMEFAQSAPMALRRITDAGDRSLILILSDINMPGMSGLELLPRAKAARPDVPIIMITAYGDAETKRQVLESGAEALLTKPIDFGTLRSEIETRVERAA